MLLRFLHSLPKALDDDLLIELIIRILRNAPDLITPYLSGYQMALDPRNSQQWLNNVVFLMKLYFHLPMPGSLFNTDLAISPENINESRLLTIACPENIKRSVLTRGLQVNLYVIRSALEQNFCRFDYTGVRFCVQFRVWVKDLDKLTEF